MHVYFYREETEEGEAGGGECISRFIYILYIYEGEERRGTLLWWKRGRERRRQATNK
jgi:hypothetical protein